MTCEFPGINSEELAAAIVEGGGKLGILQFLRAHYSELASNVLKSINIGIDEDLTSAHINKLGAMCKNMGVEHPFITVRTSHHSDWYQMVDAMPTEKKVLLDSFGGSGLKRQVDNIREKLRDQALVDFADKEGSLYDPSEAALSLSPFLNHTPITITEHPNHPGMTLIDTAYAEKPSHTREPTGEFLWDSFDFQGTKMIDDHHATNKFRLQKTLRIIEDIREIGLFEKEHALQYEGLLTKENKFLLTQIRQFAKVKSAEKRTNNPRNFQHLRKFNRNFGVFRGTLPISYGFERTEALCFEKEHPEIEYAYSPEDITSSPELDEVPKSMLVYVPSYEAHALGHNQTRYVKYALKKDGAALLNKTKDELQKLAKHGEKVDFNVNGRDHYIKAA